MLRALPDKQTLNELFDLRDGVLYWKVRTSIRVTIGDPAGAVSSRGYLRTGIRGTVYLNHRLIFLMHYGWVPDAIDHIDGNPLNNMPENMRPASKSENACNIGITNQNTSGHKGVTYNKRRGKWCASIKKNGVKTDLGFFDDVNEAGAAYAAAAPEHHGEFARTI